MASILICIYVISVLCACAYNYRLKSKKVKGISYTKCFNPLFTAGVLIGLLLTVLVPDATRHSFFYKRYIGNPGRNIIPKYILDQYLLRFYNTACMTCIENRICNVSNCGCDAKAKAFLPWEKCSDEQFMPIFWLPSEYNSYNFDTNKEYLYKNLTKAYNDSRKEKRD